MAEDFGIEELIGAYPLHDTKHPFRIWNDRVKKSLKKDRYYRRYKMLKRKLKKRKSPKGHIDIYV